MGSRAEWPVVLTEQTGFSFALDSMPALCLHGTQKGNGTPKILPSKSLPHPPALYPLESLGTLSLARDCFCEKVCGM